jgi:hypothetical protein
MLSRIDRRYLARLNSTRQSALLVILICAVVLYYLLQINFGDNPLPETEHSKQMSARWVSLAHQAGCEVSKVNADASVSGCNPSRLKPDDYEWAYKQAPGHLQEALQWALRRDRILHGEQ